MSSTNKTANYQLSQFVGTDIPSILNDYNGDMRKIDTAIKEVANAEGSSASDIAGLQATVGQHTTELGGLSSTVNSLSGRVIGIEGKIPANASESNKLITAQDIPEIPSISGLESAVSSLQNDVDLINGNIDNISDNVSTVQATANNLVLHAPHKIRNVTGETLAEKLTSVIKGVIETTHAVNYSELVQGILSLIIQIDGVAFRFGNVPSGGTTYYAFAFNYTANGVKCYRMSITLANISADPATITVSDASIARTDITSDGVTHTSNGNDFQFGDVDAYLEATRI